MAKFTSEPKLGNAYSLALQKICEWHSHQVRHDGTTPYIAHLMAVSSLVLEAGGTEATAIGALLHDTPEDVWEKVGAEGLASSLCQDWWKREFEKFGNSAYRTISINYIEKLFGDTVRDLVVLLTHEQKESYLAGISRMVKNPEIFADVLLVSAADTLHNLRGYAAGGATWTQDRAAHYDALVKAYASVAFEPYVVVPSRWLSEMYALLRIATMTAHL